MEMPRTDSTQAMQTLIGAYADDVSDDEDEDDSHNISGSEDEAIHSAATTQNTTNEHKSDTESGTPEKKARFERRTGNYCLVLSALSVLLI